MIGGNEINELVSMLEDRQTCLYHACQLEDFQAYLRLGGIPSRAYLEQNRECFTPFETDGIDQENKVWDKVFVNLSDFGEGFARGSMCVPNPYGPIVLQLRPSTLHETADVAVCLRTAGCLDFDRQQEALRRVSDIDDLFFYPPDSGFPESTYVKFSEQLREINPRATNPEVSCSVEQGFLPIDDVIVAWVDPYEISGRPLMAWVQEAMIEAGADFKVHERSCREDRRELYGELLAVIYPETLSLHDIVNGFDAGHSTRLWAEEILANGLAYQFRRFANYLLEGTIQPLAARTCDEEMKREELSLYA